MRRIGPGQRDDRRRRRGGQGKPAIESPGVFAGILALHEIRLCPLPVYDCFVLGHKTLRVTRSVSWNASKLREARAERAHLDTAAGARTFQTATSSEHGWDSLGFQALSPVERC